MPGGIAAIALSANPVSAAERPRIGLVLGGLVTGAFAAGLSPDEMLAALGKADWRGMYKDQPQASEVNLRKRIQARRSIPGPEIGGAAESANALPAVVDGQKIKLFINQLVHSEYGEPQIEKLLLPVTIVANDLVTGDQLALREVSLTKAMRPTMSVPG